MHTTHANFSNDAVAQAIAGAQAMIERLPYKGKAARKVEKLYTVEGIAGPGVKLRDEYFAYDEGDAMRKFAEDYGVRATNAYRTQLAK